MSASYCSLLYLAAFLPAVILLYLILPQKARPILLLAASWFFFWSISGTLIICLIFSVLVIHGIGLKLDGLKSERDEKLKNPGDRSKKEIKAEYQKYMRRFLAIAILLNIGLLAFYKYMGFTVCNINSVIKLFGCKAAIDIPSYAAPIGISFYTMQAMAYIFDVYREKIKADRNFFRLALFMSFFPQIVEGPICRYSDTAIALWEGKRIRSNDFLMGIQRISFGVMKKIIVADRLNIVIGNIYSGYKNYDGAIVAASAVFYALQLYMEFSGTMDIVIGSAEIFGITMPENFSQPFFSKTISEFWKRWHITLGTWFRDYIFYPAAMSKPLKELTTNARKKLGNHFGPLASSSIALFCVWLCNGIWHGAGWQYIFYGMYHFSFILVGNIIEPFVISAAQKLHIRRTCKPYVIMQTVRTFIIVCIGEMFFNAHGLRAGFEMLGKILTDFTPSSLWNGTLFKLGIDKLDILIICVALLIVLSVSITKEKKISLGKWIISRPLYVRIPIYYSIILFIAIFGAYGTGYVPVDPMYANF